jgi:predicted metal-dependent hydrolase
MPLSPQRLSATTRASLARGAVLYDAGLYWESHEAWEEAWLVEQGDPRVLLQGLIQVAAGFHKATVQRQPNGCVKLLSAGLDKLRAVPEDLLGSELAAFTAKVESALREALRWQAGEVAGVAKGSIPTLGPDFSMQP